MAVGDPLPLHGVDPQHLLGGTGGAGPHPAAPGEDVGRGVGEVVLPLGVVGPELVDGLPQGAALKDVDPHVQLPDGLLLGGTVLVLHDAGEGTVAFPHDAAVGQLLVGHGGEQRAVVALPLVGLDEGLVGGPAHEGHVAVAHQHAAVKARQGLPGALHRVAGALLGLLHGVGVLRVGRQHLLPLVAHHQHHVLLLQEGQLLQHIAQQGAARRLPQHLGQIHPLGAQAGALARRQNHRLDSILHGIQPRFSQAFLSFI